MLKSWAQPYCQQPQTDEVARTFRSGGPAAPGLPARAGFVGLITARAARAYSPGANLTRPRWNIKGQVLAQLRKERIRDRTQR